MQFLAILASLVSVAAFAPSARMASSSALKMSFEDALGAQAPLGFWDPLGKYLPLTILLLHFLVFLLCNIAIDLLPVPVCASWCVNLI